MNQRFTRILSDAQVTCFGGTNTRTSIQYTYVWYDMESVNTQNLRLKILQALKMRKRAKHNKIFIKK